MALELDPASILWKEDSPGHFSRDYDEMERWYEAYGNPGKPYGSINARVTTICEYKTSQVDIVDTFRKAWGYMYAAHPHIGCQIETKGLKRVYSADAAKAQENETFVIVKDKSVRQVFANLGDSRVPVLHVFPVPGRLMINAPHSFSDGRGQFHFFSKFFDAVQAINEGRHTSPSAFGSVASRLAPAFNTIAPVPAGEELLKKAGEVFADIANYPDGIPAHDVGSFPPGTPTWAGVRFSETETAEILRKVKARGATLTPVAHAAIITATQRMTGAQRSYFGSIPVDLRRYCGRDASQPLTVYVGVTMRLIQPGTFDEVLERTLEAYKTVQDDYKGGLMRAFGKLLGGMAETEASYEPLPRFMPDLTNPGNIDQFIKPFYGTLEIEEVKQQLQEEFYAIFVSLESFRGKLRASISYNERYRRKEEIERYAVLFREELLSGLGVENENVALEVPDPQPGGSEL